VIPFRGIEGGNSLKTVTPWAVTNIVAKSSDDYCLAPLLLDLQLGLVLYQVRQKDIGQMCTPQ
jgi:hypothetical protein